MMRWGKNAPVATTRRRCATVIVWVCLLLASASGLAAETVQAILEDQRVNGYPSKSRALSRLQAATDKPSSSAPLADRYRYYAALARLAADAEQTEPLRIARAQLESMIRQRCQTCEVEVLILDAEVAVRHKETARTTAILDKLPAPSTLDLRRAQRVAFVRAQLADAQGRTAAAIEHAIEAENLAHRIGDIRARVNAMIMQAAITINREDFERVSRLSDETFALAQQYGMTDRMAAVRINQAYMYSLQGKSNESYRHLMQALEIANQDPGLNELRLTALGNLAAWFLESAQFEQGLEYSRQTVQLARQMNHPSMEIVGLNNWGSAEIRLGKPESGLQRVHEAWTLAQRRGTHQDVMQMHAQLSWAYYDLGRYREAYLELKKFEELLEQTSQQDRDRAVLELQEQSSAERKSREIQRLSLDNARRQVELEARTWKQRLWATIALALLLLGVVLHQWFGALRRRNHVLQDSNVALNDQSSRDALTGAYNRRHCEELFIHQSMLMDKQPDTADQCIGLMLIDLDHFKQINDVLGHDAGDAALRRLSATLRRQLRPRDVAGRLGGDEFAVLLRDSDADEAARWTEQLRVAMEGLGLEGSGLPQLVSISAGVATWDAAMRSGHEFMRLADQALLRAKAAGRNCVRAAIMPG